MIRIAALDDSKSDRELMEEITRTYFLKRKIPFEIAAFSRSDRLYAELAEQKYYDIFLLDMEMPDKTGLEVAKEIRRYYMEPMIVYVTRHVEYAPAAFEVNAFRYIPKVLIKEKLPEAYGALLTRLAQLDKRSYVLEKENGIERILFRNIFYIRKDGKYVTIFHRYGTSRQRTTLQDIFERLNAKEFFYVDKSYIVNVQHIMFCKRGEIHMRNGEILPVSRPRYNDVKNKIMEYWKG